MNGAAGAMWLGWRGAQWLALCGVLFTLVALAESFLGHYRSGFAVRMQYSPFAVGIPLVTAFLAAIVAPASDWTHTFLRIVGIVAIGLSVVGVGYHWYFGVVEKPGGVRWLLHHLMYHAPLLAPLALAVAGGIALTAAASLAGKVVIGTMTPALAAMFLTVAGVTGLVMQVAPLHYRGAFINRAMWLPLIVGGVLIVSATWHLASSSPASRTLYLVVLWTAFINGFAGWGWHLRGVDRMMGGLYVRPNLLEGPPPLAPLLFALVAMTGIVGATLL